MWFKKKTELEKLILDYGKDTDILLEFATSAQKPHIEDVTLEDVKEYYKAVLAQRTPFTAQAHVKAVRMFFRENRGKNCLRASEIRDNPLDTVVKNDIVQVMPEMKKNPRGRPANIEMIKKVKVMREDLKLSFRKIGAAVGKDSKQAFMWYEASKTL